MKIVAVDEFEVNSVVMAPISTNMKRKSNCGIAEKTCSKKKMVKENSNN